ncbi:hypothetical protein AEST_03240 [Alishewanella aestuarii B11]|uniref:Uncharacterized protein n=1 Tax=Alishewanella aestuarii B11 TaxID=1197174 RepID=J1Q6G0_9ALTE|nr:hypothetical protein [Alishewanella aestuarii]EJI86778.1 hypothetical protein AEST_03240 [Alishewanella aestuarii B11]
MKKTLIISLGALLMATAGFYYGNYKAERLIAGQIELINSSYAEMASQGLMPAVQLNYSKIRANYWRDHYRLSGLQLQIAGVGTVAEIGRLSIRGFKPGKLSQQGELRIQQLQLSNLLQQMLPPEVGKLLAASPLWLDYRYQYQPTQDLLTLQQQLRVGDAMRLELQLQLTAVQALWQLGSELAAMDLEQQQAYQQGKQQPRVQQALAALQLVSGELTLENNGYLQQLQPVLLAQPATAQLAELKPQLEVYVQSTELVTERIRENLLLFLHEPQRLKLSFNLQRPLTWQQLQSGELTEELTTPEQWVAFTGLLVEAN